jgi:arabinose-5-phosphate isomerase
VPLLVLIRWRKNAGQRQDPLRLNAGQCMTRNPKTISAEQAATAALAKMEELKITSLVVVDARRTILGVIHIHDLWRTQMF